MLRLSLISLFASVITMMVSSCSDDDCIDNQSDKVEAEFILTDSGTNVAVDVKTKAVEEQEEIVNENDGIIVESVNIEKWDYDAANMTKTSWGTSGGTTSWTANDKIGIFMRSASGGSSYYDLDNIQYNVTSTAQSSAVTPVSTTIYYPNPNTENVVFYAYYPYSSSNNSTSISYTIPSNQTGASAIAATDLMSATSTSASGASPNATLNFQHQLVLLSFKITAGLTGGLLSSVTVGGTSITNTGTLNLVNNTLTSNASPTFTPISSVGITLLPLGTTTVDIIINPCTISNNTGTGSQLYVTFNYAGVINRRTNLTTNQVFSSGTRYTYTINFLI